MKYETLFAEKVSPLLTNSPKNYCENINFIMMFNFLVLKLKTVLANKKVAN